MPNLYYFNTAITSHYTPTNPTYTVYVWPDLTYCFQEDLSEYLAWKSDDYILLDVPNNIEDSEDLENFIIKEYPTMASKSKPLSNIEVLRLFLKAQRKLTAVRKYIIKYSLNNMENPSNNLHIEEALSWGFRWSSTKEGHEYWQKQSNTWMQLVNKFRLTGRVDLTAL